MDFRHVIYVVFHLIYFTWNSVMASTNNVINNHTWNFIGIKIKRKMKIKVKMTFCEEKIKIISPQNFLIDM